MKKAYPQNVKSLGELRKVAELFLRGLVEMPTQNTATVVGLSGDLGSGKTAFTKCVADILGITEVVTSPTFILEKIYMIPRGSIAGERFAKLIHIDAYRLEGGLEMAALDWQTLLLGPHNLILIEWPEQVVDAMPNDMIKISFQYVSEGVREVVVNI
jgi:tRNA threonylcarbamoyladenosine biosynthesis protein TsaE